MVSPAKEVIGQRYYFVSLAVGTTIFLYDSICTFPEEYQYIWKDNGSIGKVLDRTFIVGGPNLHAPFDTLVAVSLYPLHYCHWLDSGAL
jgi:hypothetical protein